MIASPSDQTYLEIMNAEQTALSDGKTVELSLEWTLGPHKPDILEIYYSFTPDQGLENATPPYFYATIDPSTKQPYAVSIGVIGYPALLFLSLAPRLVSNGQTEIDMPDEEGDKLKFYEFAATVQNLPIHYQPQPKPVAIATVADIQSAPKTLQSPNHFTVTCTASGGTIDDFNLIPTKNGTDLKQQEASSGVFTQPATAGDTFAFKAQAHNKESGWGPWSAQRSMTATANYHSVAAFLGASNVKLPAALRPIVTQYKATSLRNLLGI
jgi:hypothetical protein